MYAALYYKALCNFVTIEKRSWVWIHFNLNKSKDQAIFNCVQLVQLELYKRAQDLT